MMIHSIRLKLTLLYALTVAVLLGVFIGADMVGLHRNLMEQVGVAAMSTEAMHETWLRAITEHISLALVLVVVVFVFGYVFIRRALQPVREITRTAKAISEKDLSLRVETSGDKAEIGELADTLNDMIARLENSFTRTRRFSADAAHELSTPLTILKGEIEVTLRHQRDGEEYVNTLQRLLGQIERLTVIVDNLLFLSRADEHSLTGLDTEVSLDTLLLTVFENFQSMARQQEVSLGLGSVDSTTVCGDQHLLLRMLNNIVGNAVKFTPSGGNVTLSLENRDGRFVLQVADTGMGIPKEDLPHVFDRFLRVEKSRSKATGGAGLGLSIVREIADAHGLKIDIESEPGAGTRVVVTGPVS